MTSIELIHGDPPSAARQLLFRDTAGTETPSEVVRWWEKRRLAYNIAVGSAGLVSVGAMMLAGAVTGIPLRGELPFVFVYAAIANICYSGGWVAELLLRPVFREKTGTVGATMFRYGLAFSVILTLLPVPIAAITIVLRALTEMLN